MSTPEDRLAEIRTRLRQQRIRQRLEEMRNPGLIERGVGLARQGLAGIGDMIGTTTVGAMRAVGESPLLRPGLQDDLLEGRVTAPDEDGNVLTRGADILQGQYEDFREETAPEGMGETVARVGGRLFGEGAKYMAGGAAIRGAAGFLTGASRVPTPVLPTMRGRAVQGIQEAARDAMAVLPLDIATTAYGPEESVLGAAAELTGNKTLRDLSENRAARLAAEVGTSFGMDVAIRGLAGGVKAGARGVAQATDLVGDLSPAIREGLEGAETVGDATLPVGYEMGPLDPMSAQAAALRRADELRRIDALRARLEEQRALARARDLRGPEAPTPAAATAFDPPILEAGQPQGLEVVRGRNTIDRRPPTAIAPELPRVRSPGEQAALEAARAEEARRLPGRVIPREPAMPSARDPRGELLPEAPPATVEQARAVEAMQYRDIGRGDVLPVQPPRPGLLDARGRPIAGTAAEPQQLTDTGGRPLTRAAPTPEPEIPAAAVPEPEAPRVEATEAAPAKPFRLTKKQANELAALSEGSAFDRALDGMPVEDYRVVNGKLEVVDKDKTLASIDNAIDIAEGNEASVAYIRGLRALRDRVASDERGFALPALTRTLAGAGVGATGGAVVDDENPLRGALIGGVVGAGAANIKAFGESDLYRRVVDQTQPIVDLGYKLGGGSKLRDELSAFRGFRGAAAQMIRGDNGLGGVIKQINANDFTPAPVTPARNAVRGALSLDGLTRAEAEVAELMTAQRAIELAGRGMTDKVPFSVEQAQEVVAVLQPKVGAQADALRAYYSELLDMRLKAGVITQSDYDAIKAANEFYTPFTRDFGDEALPQRGERGRDGRALSGKKGVRRIEEGVATSPIMDPFTQAVEDTNETFRRVGKQRVTNLVAKLVEENPEAAAPFLRRVPNNAEPSRNAKIVQANVNGQRQSFEVLDEDLYEAWAGMDEYIGNIAIRIMAVPRKVLRETVTILPDFAIANAIRDNMMSVVQYPLPVRGAAAGTAIGAAGGAATAEEGERGAGALRGAALGLGAGAVTPQLARMVGAMKNIIADDAIYEEFVKQGGVGSGFYVRNATDARRVVNQLRKGGFNATDVINPVSYWNALQAINRVVEEAPRLARYKYGQGVGVLGSAATDATRAAARETAAESIFGARDISLDFARMGADMKGWNAMVAFQNAKIQGYDKLARMANLKTAGVGLAAITAPTIALWTINSEDPEYWDVPLWERNLFWLIPKSAEARARGEGAFWKIPKPFEVGFIFASLPERILDFAKQKDPESLRAALADMTSTYGQMQGIPTGAMPVIEGMADYSFFRGRALNPEQYANIPPEFQFDNRTSSVAVEAGQRLGVSPAKIDNALRGYFGSFGNEVNQVLTKVARMAGVDERPEPPTGRTPLLGRFSTQDATAGELEQSVRRRFRKADAARTMVRRMLEDGDVEGAREYARERADVLRDYNQLKAYNDALGDVSRARRAITNAPGLSADEKARRLAEINRRVSERLSNLNR